MMALLEPKLSELVYFVWRSLVGYLGNVIFHSVAVLLFSKYVCFVTGLTLSN